MIVASRSSPAACSAFRVQRHLGANGGHACSLSYKRPLTAPTNPNARLQVIRHPTTLAIVRDETSAEGDGSKELSREVTHATTLHLCVVWSRDEPRRVGESCAVTRTMVLGRGQGEGDTPITEFVQQRPGSNHATGRLTSSRLSRTQWKLSPCQTHLSVENVGKRALLHNGQACDQATARVGDILQVDGVVSFLVDARPERFATTPDADSPPFDFGRPDPDGRVGESPAIWRLRHELQVAASSGQHTLIEGAAGSGKESCARGVHRLSRKVPSKFVARNVATIPASLIDAELFGNAKDYPNAGLPARPGLVGSADGGTLFLDEIEHLSTGQQTALLRVLETGEYQRLGETQVRKSTLTLIGATNRPAETLQRALLEQLKSRVEVPPLSTRRTDIPLLIRDMLPRIQSEGGTTISRPIPALHPELLEGLLLHEYTQQYRELERLLRLSLQHSNGEVLDLCEAVKAELRFSESFTEASGLSADTIREVLERTGSVTEAARELGLKSRYTLYRLMQKQGISVS